MARISDAIVYDYATNGKWGPGENPYREDGADRG